MEGGGFLKAGDAGIGDGEVEPEGALDGDFDVTKIAVVENLADEEALGLVALGIHVGLDLGQAKADIVLKIGVDFVDFFDLVKMYNKKFGEDAFLDAADKDVTKH